MKHCRPITVKACIALLKLSSHTLKQNCGCNLFLQRNYHSPYARGKWQPLKKKKNKSYDVIKNG
jgi:hypothetical protein